MIEHLLSPLHPDQERVAKSLAMAAAAQVGEAKPAPTPAPTPPVVATKPVRMPHAMPFAHRLRASLKLLGVVTELGESPLEPAFGLAIWAAGATVFTQLYVDAPDPGVSEAKALAAIICNRFGQNITFGKLVIPRGAECAGWQQSGSVWVRFVMDYHVGSDDWVHRWTVSVRKT